MVAGIYRQYLLVYASHSPSTGGFLHPLWCGWPLLRHFLHVQTVHSIMDVCLCYWLPSPALLCNAKLIWPVVFLSGKSLHFSCNPSQWRSYWELSTVPTEQCVCMNKQCACAVCVCLWCVSEQRDCYRLGTSTHQPTTSNCGQCSELDEHTLFLPLFLAFQLFSLHLFLSLHPPIPLPPLPPLHTHTTPHASLSLSDEEVQAQFRGRLVVPQRISSKLLFHPGIKFSAYLNSPLCLLLLLLSAFLVGDMCMLTVRLVHVCISACASGVRNPRLLPLIILKLLRQKNWFFSVSVDFF